MKTIKFSHRYYKMPHNFDMGTTVYQVFMVDSKDLGKDFREYDVTFEKPNGDADHYELPEGKLIVILFATYEAQINRVILWTTIRRWSTSNERYYKSLVGQDVRIEIKEER